MGNIQNTKEFRIMINDITPIALNIDKLLQDNEYDISELKKLKEQLVELVEHKLNNKIFENPMEIITEVCCSNNILVKSIRKKGMGKEVIKCRQLIHYLLYIELGYPIAFIAELTGTTSSAIYNSLSKVATEHNSTYKDVINNYRKYLEDTGKKEMRNFKILNDKIRKDKSPNNIT